MIKELTAKNKNVKPILWQTHCCTQPFSLWNEDSLITMNRMPDNAVNHCLTSPPYNYNLRIHTGKYTKRSVNEKKSM